VTPHELLAAIEGTGGTLRVSSDGQRIHCRLPRRAEWLVELARQHRDELKALLTVNVTSPVNTSHAVAVDLQQFPSLVVKWLAEHCVSSSRCASNPHILHREFSRFANCEPESRTLDLFLEELETLGFSRDKDAMVLGLALADDFMAAWNRESHRKTNEIH
jgi:hypothetical protein